MTAATMDVGIIVPQGWTGEYAGLASRPAWERTVSVARQAEALGFESIWLFDHFHTTPEPTDEITFESFTTLTALAAATDRVRLGHTVVCAGFRNPALLAKMVSTLDVISGGRVDLGVGAGWKREEWEAYGYDFPPTRDRLGRLEETLAIVQRMFGPGRASFEGRHARVAGAINEPKPLHAAVPIVVGGNGRERTWRLAARYADELNVDAMPPEEVPEAKRVLAERCAEIGRDPASLRLSVHIWWEHLDAAPSRSELLERYREAGVARVMALVRASATSDEALPAFAEDARAAGCRLAPSLAMSAASA